MTVALMLGGLIGGCDTSGVDHRTTRMWYRAVNKDDTATFKVDVTDGQFKGVFEINYHGSFKDSGEVKGYVHGDTLVGNYLYRHYGMEQLHRIPVAFLKSADKLIMGVGAMEIYLERTYFKKNKPIDYQNVKFIFEKMD
ncbi:MAG TPA: hypothetical protein VKB19_18890 [Pedobacter sp.]|nr:hypothetical protein [Pedobacter sp.]